MNFLGKNQNVNVIIAEVRHAAITENNPVFIVVSSSEGLSFKEKVLKVLKETILSIKEADKYITTNYPKTFNV